MLQFLQGEVMELVLRVLTGATVRRHCWDYAVGTACIQKENIPSPRLLASFLYCFSLAEPNWQQRESVLCRGLVPVSQNRLQKPSLGVRDYHLTTAE